MNIGYPLKERRWQIKESEHYLGRAPDRCKGVCVLHRIRCSNPPFATAVAAIRIHVGPATAFPLAAAGHLIVNDGMTSEVVVPMTS